jgi:hypothetical protein
MRSKGVKEISDFVEGMDSSSYPGVIAGRDNRFPLIENGRILDNGRLDRRKGYGFAPATDIRTSSTRVKATEIFNNLAGSSDDYLVAAWDSFSGVSTMQQIKIRSGFSATDINDYDGVPNTAKMTTPGISMAKDGPGAALYLPGDHATEDPNTGNLKGIIVDVAVTSKARRWGIVGPAGAPSQTEAIGFIPAAAAGGWYYFYTYIRLVSGTLVAESTPSPVPASRIANAVPKSHDIGVTASTDPQVTEIRLYRTRDGGAIENAGFINDYANTTATINIDIPDGPGFPSIAVLLDTFDFYPFNFSGAPKPAKGTFAVKYKDQIIVGGVGSAVYFTLNTAIPKFKTLFHALNFSDFYDTVLAIFIHFDDIIICTACETWVITEGDFINQKRLANQGVGVIAHNSIAFDPMTQRTIALTNKGVRAWDGRNWSEDLSYQIRGDIENATTNTTGDPSETELATAAVINRYYYLSFRGRQNGNTNNRIFTAFLRNDGSLSWSVDIIRKADETPMLAYVQGKIHHIPNDNGAPINTYNQQPVAIMRVDMAETVSPADDKNRLVLFEEKTDYDFEDSGLVKKFNIIHRIKLPRLIHGSPRNYIRLRNIRISSTLKDPFSISSTAPIFMECIARGDDGRVFERIKLVQDKIVTGDDSFKWSKSTGPVNAGRWGGDGNPLGLKAFYTPSLLNGHFSDAFASGFMDLEILYKGTAELEINSISTFYIFRDRALAVA